MALVDFTPARVLADCKNSRTNTGLCAPGVAMRGYVQQKSQYMVGGGNPDLHAAKTETAQQQAGTDEEHKRDRSIGKPRESAAQAGTFGAGAGASSVVAQDLMPRWNEKLASPGPVRKARR